MHQLHRIIGLLFFGFAATGWSQTTRFDLRDAGRRNVVHFVSEARLERIVGLTTAVWGQVEVDPANLRRGIKGELEVDVRTFETGMEARDKALRETIFSGDVHPVAKFTIRKWVRYSSLKLRPGKSVNVEVEGELEFRGVKRLERMKGTLTYFSNSSRTQTRGGGDLLKIQGELSLQLSHYFGVWPAPWRDRIAPNVKLELGAVGTDNSPAKRLDLPDGDKPKERS